MPENRQIREETAERHNTSSNTSREIEVEKRSHHANDSDKASCQDKCSFRRRVLGPFRRVQAQDEVYEDENNGSTDDAGKVEVQVGRPNINIESDPSPNDEGPRESQCVDDASQEHLLWLIIARQTIGSWV